MTPSIRDYVMKNETVEQPFGVFVGAIEVIEGNKICPKSFGCVSLRVSDVINRTEQEILQGIIEQAFFTTYTCVDEQIPNNTKVYLHINGKRYLISK